MELIFEWDEEKAKLNIKKHRVSFEEAKTVFDDPFLMTFPDEDHSVYENRFLNVGMSARSRVLVVVHTERHQNAIRIISCRKATRLEKSAYEEANS